MTEIVHRWQHPGTGQTITFQDRRPRPEPVVFPFTKADVASHEAAHAAAALLLDMRVVEASADFPDFKVAGHVVYSGNGDTRDEMVAILVGPLSDPSAKAWPPAWPLDPEVHGDEGHLVRLAENIVLTEYGYEQVVADARSMVKDPTFRELKSVLSALLECGTTLTERMLNDLRDIVVAGRHKSTATTLRHKSFELVPGQAEAGEAGSFEATVAVFGNVDRGGDRIMPGAFKNTLEQWKASGDPIPVIFNHDWANPHAHIGVVDQARETDRGLWVKGTLDVADNEVARQVHKLMARRSLKEFSFGYEVPEGGERKARDGANELYEINLAEVGPTLKGMNPDTELHAVKSAVAIADPNRPTADELRRQCDRLAAEFLIEGLDLPAQPERRVPTMVDLDSQCRKLGLPTSVRTMATKADDPDDTPSLDDLRDMERDLGLDPPEIIRFRQDFRELVRVHMTGDSNNGNHDASEKRLTAAELKAKADRIAHEFATRAAT
jgi:HK97 family phage prohead protease